VADPLARLDQIDPWCRHVAGRPTGEGWSGLDEAVALVPDWLDHLQAGVADGHVDVAASYLTGWLGGLVVGTVATALAEVGCTWAVGPETVAVHRHVDGWFDAIAVAGAPIGPPDDLATLRARAAAGAAGALDPVFRAVRSRAPFGRAGMWGAVADRVTVAAVERARDAGQDPCPAFHQATAFVDALARHVRIGARPALCSVPSPDGRAPFVVRGTCCLAYKAARGLDPDEARCTDCPLRARSGQ
jgi:ferric iron reductase protein FhuF